MEDFHIRNFVELWEVLSSLKTDRRWMFRGQGAKSWKLIPKAGRSRYSAANDRLFFEKWQRHAFLLLPPPHPADDWEWLAVSQHFGLPTRLLDWTVNPLAAAYFAVEQGRGAATPTIYGVCRETEVATERGLGPFDPNWKGVRVVGPRNVVGRLSRQASRFTIHQPPTTPLSERTWAGGASLRLIRILIAPAARQTILRDLHYIGINRAFLMGDLDSVSQMIGWQMEGLEDFADEEIYISTDWGDRPLSLPQLDEHRHAAWSERFGHDGTVYTELGERPPPKSRPTG